MLLFVLQHRAYLNLFVMQHKQEKRTSSATTKLTKSQLLTELNQVKAKLKQVQHKDAAIGDAMEFHLLAAAGDISTDDPISLSAIHRRNLIRVLIAAIRSEDLFQDEPLIDHSEIISCLKILQVIEFIK